MKELMVEASIGNIETVTNWINEELEQMDCPMKVMLQMDVAIDEIFANIAEYAYPESTGHVTIQLEFDDQAQMIVLTFIDKGIPYNPLEKEDPDIKLSAEERAVGGLGIFLVKKTMDIMEYEYVNEQNVLRLKKKI